MSLEDMTYEDLLYAARYKEFENKVLRDENASLRKLAAENYPCGTCEAMLDCDECTRADASHKARKALVHDIEQLRELIRDMWHDGMCDCDEQFGCSVCEYGYLDRMRALGIEVNE